MPKWIFYTWLETCANWTAFVLGSTLISLPNINFCWLYKRINRSLSTSAQITGHLVWKQDKEICFRQQLLVMKVQQIRLTNVSSWSHNCQRTNAYILTWLSLVIQHLGCVLHIEQMTPQKISVLLKIELPKKQVLDVNQMRQLRKYTLFHRRISYKPQLKVNIFKLSTKVISSHYTSKQEFGSSISTYYLHDTK